MSMFFNALEHAEHDGNGRQPERTSRERSMSAAPAMPAAPPAPVERRAVDGLASAPREIDEHLVSLVEPSSFASEQYRVLRHALEQLHRTAGHSIFGIGSPSASDGKTTTALNLAGALGQARDARVLLIEADLRCPTMAARLGLEDDGLPGLVEAIQSPDASIADVARRWGDTVNTASRMQSSGVPGRIAVAQSTHDLLQDVRRLRRARAGHGEGPRADDHLPRGRSRSASGLTHRLRSARSPREARRAPRRPGGPSGGPPPASCESGPRRRRPSPGGRRA